jgi:gluconokinase
LEWDPPLLAALPIEAEQLSPLVDVDVPRQGLRDRFSDRWSALQDVPWFPAVGDGAAANVGSGCVTPAKVALTMGTTSAVRLVTEEEVEHVPGGLWCYRVDGHRSLPGGALSEGGNIFAWMRDTLQLPGELGLDDALARMVPDGHGLTVLPFLAGERSPGWVGEARATLHGLGLATTPLDILRASMEGVAFRIALIFDRLGPLLPADFQVVASGGALRNSPVWVQIIADVLGQPVASPDIEEASARGAAVMALEALGVLGHLGQAPPSIEVVCEPDTGYYASYAAAVQRQQALYESLIDGASQR